MAISSHVFVLEDETRFNLSKASQRPYLIYLTTSTSTVKHSHQNPSPYLYRRCSSFFLIQDLKTNSTSAIMFAMDMILGLVIFFTSDHYYPLLFYPKTAAEIVAEFGSNIRRSLDEYVQKMVLWLGHITLHQLGVKTLQRR